ncbi:MAG: hypothetical protein WAV95_19605 [Azonexus sp.]
MKRLAAYEFAQRVDARIEALPPEQFRERQRDAKRLLEELYPLSRLALSFKQPGLHVLVEAHEDSGRADGKIWLSGFLDKSFEVQVTFAGYGRPEALRASLLLRQGSGPGEPERKADETPAIGEPEDTDVSISKLAASICERGRSKVAKSYAPGTVLLIAFEDVRLRGQSAWSRLYWAIENAGRLEQGPFARVYLFNSYSNELQQVA